MAHQGSPHASFTPRQLPWWARDPWDPGLLSEQTHGRAPPQGQGLVVTEELLLVAGCSRGAVPPGPGLGPVGRVPRHPGRGGRGCGWGQAVCGEGTPGGAVPGPPWTLPTPQCFRSPPASPALQQPWTGQRGEDALRRWPWATLCWDHPVLPLSPHPELQPRVRAQVDSPGLLLPGCEVKGTLSPLQLTQGSWWGHPGMLPAGPSQTSWLGGPRPGGHRRVGTLGHCWALPASLSCHPLGLETTPGSSWRSGGVPACLPPTGRKVPAHRSA